MTVLRAIGLALCLLALRWQLRPAPTRPRSRAIIAKFATAKGFPAIEAVVRELGATGDPAVETALDSARAKAISTSARPTAQVFIVKEAGASVSLIDPLTRRAGRRGGQGRAHQDQGQQRPARRHPRRARHADAGAPDPAVRLAAAETCSAIPIRPRSPRSTRRSPRRPTPRSRRGSSRRARRPCSSPTCAEADKLAAIDVLARTRRPRGAVAADLVRRPPPKAR